MSKLNMKHKIKKQWKQPHFIVLVRNNAEERVLVGCKATPGEMLPGPTSQNDACAATGLCTLCNDVSLS
jgi:hypothetical protein